MNKSLAELFLISEQFDPTQELIANILINTTDGDEDTEADLKLKELAKQVELGQITVDNAKAELSILTQGETPEGDLDEDIVAEEFDDEGRMAKSDLLKLTQYSAKLYKALEDNEQLPGWIQAKITLAADYIGTVKHYLEGEEVMGNQEAPTDQLKEAADYTETYHWEDFHLEIFGKSHNIGFWRSEFDFSAEQIKVQYGAKSFHIHLTDVIDDQVVSVIAEKVKKMRSCFRKYLIDKKLTDLSKFIDLILGGTDENIKEAKSIERVTKHKGNFPDFIVGGPAKSATSSLHSSLKRHSKLLCSESTKELHVFSSGSG